MKYSGFELTSVQEEYVRPLIAKSKSLIGLYQLWPLAALSAMSWVAFFEGPHWVYNLVVFYYWLIYTVGFFFLGLLIWLMKQKTFALDHPGSTDKILFSKRSDFNKWHRLWLYGILGLHTVVFAAAGWFLLAAVSVIFAILMLWWRTVLVSMIRMRLDQIQYTSSWYKKRIVDGTSV